MTTIPFFPVSVVVSLLHYAENHLYDTVGFLIERLPGSQALQGSDKAGLGKADLLFPPVSRSVAVCRLSRIQD